MSVTCEALSEWQQSFVLLVGSSFTLPRLPLRGPAAPVRLHLDLRLDPVIVIPVGWAGFIVTSVIAASFIVSAAGRAVEVARISPARSAFFGVIVKDGVEPASERVQIASIAKLRRLGVPLERNIPSSRGKKRISSMKFKFLNYVAL